MFISLAIGIWFSDCSSISIAPSVFSSKEGFRHECYAMQGRLFFAPLLPALGSSWLGSCQAKMNSILGIQAYETCLRHDEVDVIFLCFFQMPVAYIFGQNAFATHRPGPTCYSWYFKQIIFLKVTFQNPQLLRLINVFIFPSPKQIIARLLIKSEATNLQITQSGNPASKCNASRNHNLVM